MKIKYFRETDTAILEFSDQAISETKEISENIYIDIDEHGNVINITIEHAKKTSNLPDLSFQEIEKIPA